MGQHEVIVQRGLNSRSKLGAWSMPKKAKCREMGGNFLSSIIYPHGVSNMKKTFVSRPSSGLDR